MEGFLILLPTPMIGLELKAWLESDVPKDWRPLADSAGCAFAKSAVLVADKPELGGLFGVAPEPFGPSGAPNAEAFVGLVSEPRGSFDETAGDARGTISKLVAGFGFGTLVGKRDGGWFRLPTSCPLGPT